MNINVKCEFIKNKKNLMLTQLSYPFARGGGTFMGNNNLC
jgi:hypothetical protein